MNMPSSSRPAPPNCTPFQYKGISYQQDSQSWNYGGDQEGGYLVAIDPKMQERLWMLKVYSVPDYTEQGLPRIGRYFREIRLSNSENVLEVECEHGFIYLVDLKKKQSILIKRTSQVDL